MFTQSLHTYIEPLWTAMVVVVVVAGGSVIYGEDRRHMLPPFAASQLVKIQDEKS